MLLVTQKLHTTAFSDSNCSHINREVIKVKTGGAKERMADVGEKERHVFSFKS
jgi:hypothetical protein